MLHSFDVHNNVIKQGNNNLAMFTVWQKVCKYQIIVNTIFLYPDIRKFVNVEVYIHRALCSKYYPHEITPAYSMPYTLPLATGVKCLLFNILLENILLI